ncbi:MAG: SDR family oxidoreductase [Elstera sp.]
MTQSQDALPPLFCFGYGFSAQAAARLWLAGGGHVIGTTRDPAKLKQMRAENIDAYLFDTVPSESLLSAGAILSSVAPTDSGDDPVLQRYAPLLAQSAARWIGYLSTTGVYGEANGDWIDETAPLAPTTERGRRRVQAEAAWLKLYEDYGLPVHLFRLSGIYGPGRSALETVLAGRAQRVEKPGQVFNRIHVEDIAATLWASWQKPSPGQAYNLADDEPAPPQDVIAYACTLAGVPVPPLVPLEEAQLSPMARSFYAENKRLKNQKIKAELGVTLVFPTYREGLTAEWQTRAAG